MGRLAYLRDILAHPLTKSRRLQTMVRCLQWFLVSRITPGPVLVPFVNNARLLVSAGMRGATENIYTGLSEFEDMAFVMHFLRPTDLFIDVGANVGVYSILASAVAGSSSIAFEPVPDTFAKLQCNMFVNDLTHRVSTRNQAVGNRTGTVGFTSMHDTKNRVATPDDVDEKLIVVSIVKLDDAVIDRCPTFIKIDVEGFEKNVLLGAEKILGNELLKCVIIETNGSGERYGVEDIVLSRMLTDHGFQRYYYSPLARALNQVANSERNSKRNSLYLRNVGEARERVREARCFEVNETFV